MTRRLGIWSFWLSMSIEGMDMLIALGSSLLERRFALLLLFLLTGENGGQQCWEPDIDQAFHDIVEQINRVITKPQIQPNTPSSPAISLPSAPPAAVGTPYIDISGGWRAYGDFEMYLSQVGEEIAGTGSVGTSKHDRAHFALAGTIYGTSIKLKGTPSEKKYYASLELNLTFLPSGKLHGYEASRKHGLFNGNKTKERTFSRYDPSAISSGVPNF
jgi:hypothetical protein